MVQFASLITAKQLTLFSNAVRWMIPIDPLTLLKHRARPLFQLLQLLVELADLLIKLSIVKLLRLLSLRLLSLRGSLKNCPQCPTRPESIHAQGGRERLGTASHPPAPPRYGPASAHEIWVPANCVALDNSGLSYKRKDGTHANNC